MVEVLKTFFMYFIWNFVVVTVVFVSDLNPIPVMWFWLEVDVYSIFLKDGELFTKHHQDYWLVGPCTVNLQTLWQYIFPYKIMVE